MLGRASGLGQLDLWATTDVRRGTCACDAVLSGNTVQRYKVDEAARDRLRAEVLHGFTKVRQRTRDRRCPPRP